MKKMILLTTLFIVAIYFPILAQSAETKAEFFTTEVEIKGLVEKPMTLTVQDLKKRKGITGKDFVITSHTGAVRRTLDSYTGVLLKDVLDEAKIVMNSPKDRGKYYILITASDGYKVLFSYNELYSSNTGEQVFLLYEENGKPIEEDGAFVVICASDEITGPRHVKWVESVTVNRLD